MLSVSGRNEWERENGKMGEGGSGKIADSGKRKGVLSFKWEKRRNKFPVFEVC